MPVKLRLRRQGRRNAAHYSIVAADGRSPRDGKFIEKVGFYNPLTHPAEVYIDSEAALKWLKNGAQPTDTVRSILRYTGVNLKYALIKQGKSEEEIERIFNRWLEETANRKRKKFVMVDPYSDSEARTKADKDLATVKVPVVEDVVEEAVAEVKAVAEETAAVVEEAVAPVVEEAAAEVKAVAEETAAVVEEAVAPVVEEAPVAEAEAVVEETPAAEAETPATEAEAPAEEPKEEA
jgi:small subunit ribosomal protein S16